MNSDLYLFLVLPIGLLGLFVASASTTSIEFGESCKNNYIPFFCDKAIEHLEEIGYGKCYMDWVGTSSSKTSIYKPLYKCLNDDKTKEQCMGTGYEELRDIYGC